MSYTINNVFTFGDSTFPIELIIAKELKTIMDLFRRKFWLILSIRETHFREDINTRGKKPGSVISLKSSCYVFL